MSSVHQSQSHIPFLEPIPFARFMSEVLELYQPPLRAKNTFIRMRQVLRLTAELLGLDATTLDLTPALIARFVGSRPPGESPNTTIGLLSALRAACSYGVSQGYLRSSPFAARKSWIRPAPTTREKHHTREEIARVLDLLRREAGERGGWSGWRARRLYVMACLYSYTGLRRSEGLYLQVEDLDLAGRMIWVVARDGRRLKTQASGQPVPMAEALVPVLEDWLAHRLDSPTTSPGVPDACAARPIRSDCPWVFPGVTRCGPWTGGSGGQQPIERLKAAGRRAGVEGFTFQSLRHSFATHAEHWGMSPLMLQRILRHTTQQTQKHYRHADSANMRAAVRGIDFGLGPA